jgi:hypothetical protein
MEQCNQDNVFSKIKTSWIRFIILLISSSHKLPSGGSSFENDILLPDMAKVNIRANGLEDTGIEVPSLLLAFLQSRKPLILPPAINGKTPEFHLFEDLRRVGCLVQPGVWCLVLEYWRQVYASCPLLELILSLVSAAFCVKVFGCHGDPLL